MSKKSRAANRARRCHLCGDRCHRNGPNAVHQNGFVNRSLKEEYQRKIMAEQGWTVEQFIEEFGKNYT